MSTLILSGISGGRGYLLHCGLAKKGRRVHTMTKRQTLEIELASFDSRSMSLLAIESDSLSDEQRSELETKTGRIQKAEVEFRAAVSLDPGPEVTEGSQSADSQLTELIQRADLGAIFGAVVEHRQVAGAEGEVQQHFKLGANQVPLELLRGAPETRAVSPAPSDTGASQQPIVPAVFAEGDAAFLNIAQPTVPAGDAVFPVLTSRPTVGGAAYRLNEVAETTGSFSADALAPSRLQASFFYRRTDAARFAGMGEALRQALNAGLSEALDKQVIDQIVTDVARTDSAAIATFATYRERMIYGRLDGRFAPMESDLRILSGASTVANMAGVYRSNTADDSALDSIRRVSGGVRVSAHVAAVANKKQDSIVRRGSRMDAVAALWEGITLIPDEISKAKSGELVITAVLLAAFKTIRTDGFARIESQVIA